MLMKTFGKMLTLHDYIRCSYYKNIKISQFQIHLNDVMNAVQMKCREREWQGGLESRL